MSHEGSVETEVSDPTHPVDKCLVGQDHYTSFKWSIWYPNLTLINNDNNDHKILLAIN